MTDPTVDGWTLPKDLYAAPIVLHMDDVGAVVEAVVLPGPLGVELATADHAAVTADDLLTIAARLTQLAHAINGPTHDPNAGEWQWVDNEGIRSGTLRTKDECKREAIDLDARFPQDAPHRVVHVSELGR